VQWSRHLPYCSCKELWRATEATRYCIRPPSEFTWSDEQKWPLSNTVEDMLSPMTAGHNHILPWGHAQHFHLHGRDLWCLLTKQCSEAGLRSGLDTLWGLRFHAPPIFLWRQMYLWLKTVRLWTTVAYYYLRHSSNDAYIPSMCT